MKCIKPITLKNGLVVPCGKCELCRSHNRDNWSIRLQLHTMAYEKMPLFIALTYNNEHLTYGAYEPTLMRRDISLFIKSYKDKYNLYNTDWSYFGCGEYGLNGTIRPHYHILMFGDNELYDLYMIDSQLAKERLESVWKKGYCSIGIAEWSGIHYVTKYVLKENADDYDKELKTTPFTFCSNGIGKVWLRTKEAQEIKRNLERLTVWRNEYVELFKGLDIDVSNICGSIANLKRFFDALPEFPDFSVTLPSGKRAFLPRELRRQLVGSFEHFKDSPLWLFEYYKKLLDSLEYYRDNLEYDSKHELPMSLQKNLQRVETIKKHLIINKHKKLNHETV